MGDTECPQQSRHVPAAGQETQFPRVLPPSIGLSGPLGGTSGWGKVSIQAGDRKPVVWGRLGELARRPGRTPRPQGKRSGTGWGLWGDVLFRDRVRAWPVCHMCQQSPGHRPGAQPKHREGGGRWQAAEHGEGGSSWFRGAVCTAASGPLPRTAGPHGPSVSRETEAQRLGTGSVEPGPHTQSHTHALTLTRLHTFAHTHTSPPPCV